jgi:hypothetical protein
MAAELEQKLRLHFQKVQGRVTPEIMREATRAAGNAIVTAIQKRNEAGIGADGSAFQRRQPKYLIAKAKRMRKYSGRFAASTPSDWMRLSGGFFRSMSVKNVRGYKSGKGVVGEFTLYIKGSKEQRQVQGMMRRRSVWPMARKGTSAYQAEAKAGLTAYRQVMRTQLQGGAIINI